MNQRITEALLYSQSSELAFLLYARQFGPSYFALWESETESRTHSAYLSFVFFFFFFFTI